MANVTIGEAWGWVLAAAGAILTLSKLFDLIAVKLKPNKDMQKKIETHDRMLDADKKRLDAQEKANAVIFRALYAQINHELSGNGDEILRKSRDEIQEFLTNR